MQMLSEATDKGTPGTGVTGGYELPHLGAGHIWCPLQEQ